MDDQKNIKGQGRQLSPLICFLFLVFALFACAPEKPTWVVYMAGDSTMSIKPDTLHPERGWGMMLPDFFDPDRVQVENYAKNGRSTKTFIAEGLWQRVMDGIKPGDWVVIQFGHNDSSPHKVERYTPPEQYRDNLIRMVTEVREKGGNPLLCTPIMRRRFHDEGQFYDTHGVYPDIVRGLADSLQVTLVDMHRLSEALIIEHGVEGSKKLFLHISPGEVESLPEGLEDNTHFSPYGAKQMARLFVGELKGQELPLAKYLADEDL